MLSRSRLLGPYRNELYQPSHSAPYQWYLQQRGGLLRLHPADARGLETEPPPTPTSCTCRCLRYWLHVSAIPILVFDVHRSLELLANSLPTLIPTSSPIPDTTSPTLTRRSACVLGAFRLHYSIVTQGSDDSPCMYPSYYPHHLLTKNT
jgi:hypothetical protein